MRLNPSHVSIIHVYFRFRVWSCYVVLIYSCCWPREGGREKETMVASARLSVCLNVFRL